VASANHFLGCDFEDLDGLSYRYISKPDRGSCFLGTNHLREEKSMSYVWAFFGEIFSWIVGLLALVAVVVVLYGIGTVGAYIRRGVETKKALKKARNQGNKEGVTIDEAKYSQLNSKATGYIILPIVGILAVYFMFFLFLPSWAFFMSLIVLIVPILGYNGIFFTIGDD
jgi:hypothetical protein